MRFFSQIQQPASHAVRHTRAVTNRKKKGELFPRARARKEEEEEEKEEESRARAFEKKTP